MDIERYIKGIVEPTIRDFEANRASVRHAFLACLVTFHCVDYLENGETSKQLRQQFRKASKDFALVDRIAHAFKHASTGHESSKDNRPLKAEQVISRPPAVAGKMLVGVSRVGDAKGGVTLQGDVQTDVMDAVKGALKCVRKHMAR
ncbi:MAG: hypothetical protein ACLPL5_13465 [Stellaceae bacterium]|jgi:hypothetical protein